MNSTFYEYFHCIKGANLVYGSHKKPSYFENFLKYDTQTFLNKVSAFFDHY